MIAHIPGGSDLNPNQRMGTDTDRGKTERRIIVVKGSGKCCTVSMTTLQLPMEQGVLIDSFDFCRQCVVKKWLLFFS